MNFSCDGTLWNWALALARHEGSKKKLFNEFVTESKDILIHTPASQQLALTKARPVHTSKAGAPLVSFWDQQLKKVAKERLAQKAAKMATEPDYPEGKPAGEGNSARHSPAAKDAAAKETAVEPDAQPSVEPFRQAKNGQVILDYLDRMLDTAKKRSYVKRCNF